jgi:beta propeller repeat protein
MYDLSTKKEKRITTDDSTQWNPEIYGSTIVWQDSRNGDQDIFMYDLFTSQETQASVNISNQNSPGIYGNSIVWTDESDGNKDIYKGDSSKYNLFNSTTTEIIKKAPEGSKGGCGEKMVMVVKEFTGIYNVYMYDLSNSAETMAPPNASFFEDLDMDLGIKADDLVLVDSRYDTNKKCNVDTYELFDSELAEGKTDIKSDEIILEDSSDDGKSLNNRDTRMCDASGKGNGQKQPAANFFATPVSGKALLKVKFTDKSTGTPETWHWSFGDGTYSKAENPVHTYSKAGNYTVKLKTSNEAGTDTKTKSNYIKVGKD